MFKWLKKKKKKSVNEETDLDVKIRQLEFAIQAGEAAIRNQEKENEKNRKLLRSLQKKKLSSLPTKNNISKNVDYFKSAYKEVSKKVKDLLGSNYDPNKVDLITKMFIDKKKKKSGGVSKKTHDKIIKDLKKIEKGNFISETFSREQKEMMKQALKSGKSSLSAAAASIDDGRDFYWDNLDNIKKYNEARKSGNKDLMDHYGRLLSDAWETVKDDQALSDFEQMKKEGYIE